MGDASTVRTLDPSDAPRLAELERACFSDPWSELSLRDVLEAPGARALGLEQHGDLTAYVIARALAGVAEILTIAVEPASRRRGVARRLLDRLLAELRRERVEDVWLEVRSSNRAAQALYLSHGFTPAGMRRAYYRAPIEDALVFRLTLAGRA